MSGKPVGFEGSDKSPGEDVPLPYPETSSLPDVGKIMKDLGIEPTVPQGFQESTSPDVSVKPGGLGFVGFFGAPSEDVGFPSCETSGEFPNVEKIMKDLSIESPVSQGTPECISSASNVSDSPTQLFEVGFKKDVLDEKQDSATSKNSCDATPSTPDKKPAVDYPKKKPDIGKPS